VEEARRPYAVGMTCGRRLGRMAVTFGLPTLLILQSENGTSLISTV